MKIGICGPINPSEFKDFFPNRKQVPAINKGASAVNTYVRELLRQGHEVVVFTSAVPSNENKDIILNSEKLEIHIIHSTPGLFLTHALSRFYMVRRLRMYMRPYIKKIDVLHAQWTYDFALASKAYENVLPVFCTVRDWAPYITSLQKGMKYWQWRAYTIMSNSVLRANGIHLIANSEYTYDSIKKAYPSKDIAIIYNPIDKNLILEKRLKQPESIEFVSIASNLFEYRKNIYKLLEAFHVFHSRHPESVLNIVGNYSGHEKELEKLSSLSLLDGVRLRGLMGHQQLMEEIDNCTCLVHPALEETFGNILLEGMARCVLVIGGNKSGAVPQVLGNGEYGILCNVNDAESIVNAMEKSCDINCVEEIVHKASLNLRKKYSSDSIVNQHINLYNKYLK